MEYVPYLSVPLHVFLSGRNEVSAVRPVSVIVPTRNRAEQLAALLPLLLAQDYPRDAFEILVVDNGSTDHTAQIVEVLAPTSPVPCRYIFEPQIGITYARNRGAMEARFPYLAYCDDDCSVGNDWLYHLMEGFSLEKDVAAVGGLVLLVLGKDRPPWLHPRLEPYWASTTFLGTQTRILESEHIPECNLALEKATWREVGGFFGLDLVNFPIACEGFLLLRRIRRQGRKVAFVPQAVMYHHVSERVRPKWILWRVYQQGIADAMLAELENRLQSPGIRTIAVHMRELFHHLGSSLWTYIRLERSRGMFHLCSTLSYLGRLLGEMHLVGNWRSLRATWASNLWNSTSDQIENA